MSSNSTIVLTLWAIFAAVAFARGHAYSNRELRWIFLGLIFFMASASTVGAIYGAVST